MPATWHSTRIDTEAPGEGATPDEVSVVVLDENAQRDGGPVVIQCPPEATHGVNVAFGSRAASSRYAAFTLAPGGMIDTTELPATLQPRGPVTAWSGPALDNAGQDRPGRVVLNVTQIEVT